jgi:hypothetical protein
VARSLRLHSSARRAARALGALTRPAATPAGEQLRGSVHLVEGEVEVPAAFDDFAEFHAFATEYRNLLGRIARLARAPPARALALAGLWSCTCALSAED